MADKVSYIEQQVDKLVGNPTAAQTANEPMFKMVGANKIPVSKNRGKFWKARKDEVLSKMKPMLNAWDECLRYYEADQFEHRQSVKGASGNDGNTQRINKNWTETENVVFSTVNILLPLLYPKNPDITISNKLGIDDARLGAMQRLANRLIQMPYAPGINLKPKTRKLLMATLLTNNGYFKISWVDKKDSSEQAILELQEIGKKLSEAEDVKEIKKYEAQLIAMEQKINFLSPAGPNVRFKMPHQVIYDLAGGEDDFNDCKWMADYEYVLTDWLNSVFASEDGSSKYEPTNRLPKSSSNNDANGTYTWEDLQGSNNTNTFDNYTKVWYFWDKTTRRVEMYSDANWDYPIWVWDDPLKLPRFFPYFRLQFHTSITSPITRGEISHYLDQQDAINEIRSYKKRARIWQFGNLVYNKNLVKQDDVENILSGPGSAKGLDLPTDMPVESVIKYLAPPGAISNELLDLNEQMQTIGRMSGVHDAMRGAQFRTNTTNQQVNFYTETIEVRIEDRKDALEEFIAEVVWNITMLALMNWDKADVEPIIGKELASSWTQILDPKEFYAFQPGVEAGSSDKQNSSAKKKQIAELGQILGQFTNASPYIAIILLKMIEKAFPEAQITDDDWAMVKETMIMQLQKAGAGPEGSNPQAQEGTGDVVDKEAILEQLSKMSEEQQNAFTQLVQRGVNPNDALGQVANI